MSRWSRYDLIAIDEVGYVPLAEVGAEFLFQVIAERAERTAVIVTTNLPFSEWTQVIPNARCAKHCWIELPIKRIFWRPARNRTDSANFSWTFVSSMVAA
jgi:DNA replication protein DnaC